MATITICSDFESQENDFPLFPYLFAVKWWDRMPWSSFSECWALSQLFHSPLSPSSVKSLSRVQLFATPCQAPSARLLHPWDSPGKNIGVGCHFLLQEIFPTQGLNPGLPHCRQMLYHLSHQRSTWIIIKYWLLFPWFFNLQFFSFTMV